MSRVVVFHPNLSTLDYHSVNKEERDKESLWTREWTQSNK